MAGAFAQRPSVQPPPTTVADVMRPPLTTVEPNDHAAAAAYLVKHARTTAVMVLDAQTGQPQGIVTEADIAHVVADGQDVNSVRIYELMTTRPTVISTTTSVRDAAKVVTSGRLRHLPVVDIADVCRALLDPDILLPRSGADTESSADTERDEGHAGC
jgi:CBS domain-containing protein